MSRQRDSFPGVCAGLFTTWPVSLYLTLTLSHRAQKPGRLWDGQDNEEERMSLWLTHRNTHTQCGTPSANQDIVNKRADFISPPDACPIMTFSSTRTLSVKFLKQCINDTHSHKCTQPHGPKCASTWSFFPPFRCRSVSPSFSASLVKCETPGAFHSKWPLREWGYECVCACLRKRVQ